MRAIDRIEKLSSAEKYLESNSICNEIIEQYPNSMFGYYHRGLNNEKLKLFEEAIKDLEISEEKLHKEKRKQLLDYYFVAIPMHLSRIHFKNKNIASALENVERAIAADSKSIEALNWRSIIKEEQNDIEGAIEDVNEGIRRKPEHKGLRSKKKRLTFILTDRSG